MPDEVGTETTRSDSLSADDSLFGEASNNRDASVVREEDSTDAPPGEPDSVGEAVQGDQGTGDAGEQATETSENLKVVVSIKDGRATIGVQQPSSDPHIETFDETDLPTLAQEVTAVAERARARWEESPKHPAYVRPAQLMRRRNRRQRGATQNAATEGDADEAQEQQQTLRLF